MFNIALVMDRESFGARQPGFASALPLTFVCGLVQLPNHLGPEGNPRKTATHVAHGAQRTP